MDAMECNKDSYKNIILQLDIDLQAWENNAQNRQMCKILLWFW